MKTIEIKNRYNGDIIVSGKYESIKEALENNSDANLSGADLRGAYLSDANLSGAYLSDANLSDANLSGADLSDADLRGVNLSGADLRGANLCGADLSDANLSDAKNILLPIISITGSKHFVYSHNNNILIGCENWSISHWLENYEEIGRKKGYTEEQIIEYKKYIDIIAELRGVKCQA